VAAASATSISHHRAASIDEQRRDQLCLRGGEATAGAAAAERGEPARDAPRGLDRRRAGDLDGEPLPPRRPLARQVRGGDADRRHAPRIVAPRRGQEQRGELAVDPRIGARPGRPARDRRHDPPPLPRRRRRVPRGDQPADERAAGRDPSGGPRGRAPDPGVRVLEQRRDRLGDARRQGQRALLGEAVAEDRERAGGADPVAEVASDATEHEAV
jgi:hypothetical protein